ncbi:MAG: hypothetical protein NZ942_01200 [Candidatus Aenigmarchaeota archaeon]|nr:hypothetical protein [Candidatus Aenigmarchaeota archaeon]
MRTKFSTLGPNIKQHIKNKGEVVLGNDVRKLFTENYFIDQDTSKSEARGYLAWNLASSRKNAVYLNYYKHHEKKHFETTLAHSLRSLPSFIRDAIFLRTNEWIEDKDKILEKFKEKFEGLPFVDFTQSEKWNSLLEEEISLFFQSLNLKEKIIKSLA